VDLFGWREADTASMADAFASGNWNIFLPQVRWGGSGPNYIGAEFQTVSFIAALGYQAFGAALWVGRVVSIAFGLWASSHSTNWSAWFGTLRAGSSLSIQAYW
jgi:hypothetical protein